MRRESTRCYSRCLSDGRIHLSGIGKPAAHLTDANYEEVLGRAAHKSEREIEELVAELIPKPDVPTATGAQGVSFVRRGSTSRRHPWAYLGEIASANPAPCAATRTT